MSLSYKGLYSDLQGRIFLLHPADHRDLEDGVALAGVQHHHVHPSLRSHNNCTENFTKRLPYVYYAVFVQKKKPSAVTNVRRWV